MSFSSVVFIFCFLPSSLVVYHLLAPCTLKLESLVKKIVLLLANLVFMSWITREHTLFFTLIISVNYLVAFLAQRIAAGWNAVELPDSARLNQAADKGTAQSELSSLGAGKFRTCLARSLYLGMALVDICALLFYKYAQFLIEPLLSVLPYQELFTGWFHSLSIVQPLGISFLSFSLISYQIDCLRKTIQAESSFLNFWIWASFFPKFTSGPIARYTEMFPSSGLRVLPKPSLDDFSYGVRRFVVGLSKKVFFADIFALTVNAIFETQLDTGINTPIAWLGILVYMFQIYFDFSGYSDMAIGLAACFGFRLNENFKYPYCAKSISEFWHRWHISLSTWLRDYLYVPLGGSRRGNVYLNLTIVFLISGLWHGADWSFIAWGAWYALFMVIERLIKTHLPNLRVPAPLSWLTTMMIVLLGWVFFRAQDINQAYDYLALLFGYGSVEPRFYTLAYYLNHRLLVLLVLAALFSTPLIPQLFKRWERSFGLELIKSLATPVALLLCIIASISSEYSPFLYAQF